MVKGLSVALDNIRSRHNVGAIFRTADGAGFERVYLGGYTSSPPHPNIEKVSLGAEKNLPYESHAQLWRLIEKLKGEGVTIAALENKVKSKTVSIFKYQPKMPLLLIVGNERTGISPALLKRADVTLEIPMLGQKESLNVSVAFGVAAYFLASRVRLKTKLDFDLNEALKEVQEGKTSGPFNSIKQLKTALGDLD